MFVVNLDDGQQPSAEDVKRSLEDWSENAAEVMFINEQQQHPDEELNLENWPDRPVEVVLIEKFDDDWMTFFRKGQILFIGKLEQDWLGQWRLDDGTGHERPMSSEPIVPRDGVVMGVGGLSKGTERIMSYYFGMVSDPEVDEVLLEIEGGNPEAVPLVEGKNSRFFYVELPGEDGIPFELTAQADGEVYERW